MQVDRKIPALIPAHIEIAWPNVRLFLSPGQPGVPCTKNWSDTAKISLAPVQGWHAKTRSDQSFFFLFIFPSRCLFDSCLNFSLFFSSFYNFMRWVIILCAQMYIRRLQGKKPLFEKYCRKVHSLKSFLFSTPGHIQEESKTSSGAHGPWHRPFGCQHSWEVGDSDKIETRPKKARRQKINIQD